MSLTQIEPRRPLTDYTHLTIVSNQTGHYVDVYWDDRTKVIAEHCFDTFGPYNTRVEAVAAARIFGDLINAACKIEGRPVRKWEPISERYRRPL